MPKEAPALPKSRFVVLQASNVKEFPVDTGIFAYVGASTHPGRIHSPKPGAIPPEAIPQRLDFVKRSYDYLSDLKAEGLSRVTIKSRFSELRVFVQFADEQRALTLSKVASKRLFQKWCLSLEARVESAKISADTASGQRLHVESALLAMFDLTRNELRRGLRIAKSERSPKCESVATSTVRGFVDDLLDIISSLSMEGITGRLPVKISLTSSGQTVEHWARARIGIAPDDVVAERLKPVTVDELSPSRAGLINLRTSAEYHLFIANTAINVGQANALTEGDFKFESYKGGYNVRKYKGRKGGPVEFWITKGYRKYFERYLVFRREVVRPRASKLFSILPNAGQGKPSQRVNGQQLRYFLANANRPYVAPSKLRKSKANVIARITKSSATTALVMQHTESTLARHYVMPSFPIAVSELTRYFETIDPGSKSNTSPVEGDCQGHGDPQPYDFLAIDAPAPDCVNPKGCLFCVHHRGVNEVAYPWAQLSYAQYLRYEVATFKRRARDERAHPSAMVIERIGDEMRSFAARSSEHQEWVDLAQQRVNDEDFHPHWQFLIELMEVAI